ncbi:WXG100 family type VII secretion target [Micromonospora echinaurantiaca]|uniref:WXG100 family type VII secretion target n=1 Tax=Micromonospora echinaurantiaca TaxID=47857 RepID=UPI003798D6E5
MSEIRYNVGEMTATATAIRAYAGLLEQRLAELDRRLEPLVGDWDGQAAQAFREQREKRRRAADGLRADLELLGTQLAAAAERMSAVDRSIAGGFDF